MMLSRYIYFHPVLLSDFPIEKLKTRTLHLHVFDYDRFSRDDPIGELFIPLQDLDFSQNYDVWKPLLPPKSETKVTVRCICTSTLYFMCMIRILP